MKLSYSTYAFIFAALSLNLAFATTFFPIVAFVFFVLICFCLAIDFAVGTYEYDYEMNKFYLDRWIKAEHGSAERKFWDNLFEKQMES